MVWLQRVWTTLSQLHVLLRPCSLICLYYSLLVSLLDDSVGQVCLDFSINLTCIFLDGNKGIGDSGRVEPGPGISLALSLTMPP